MTSVSTPIQAADRLHVWMQPVGIATVASLSIRLAGAAYALQVCGPTRNPLPVTWDSPKSGDLLLEWAAESVDVSVAYVFTPKTAADTGIRVLWTSAAATIDAARHRLHARPPFGWMNDPNGLCEIDGVTHLFYQHNPHGRRWDTMHWGHAVSRDGIAWTHLPIALLPREDVVRGKDEQGGTFSGTAIARPDRTLRLFYTDRQDGRLPTREWQMTALMTDGLLPQAATPVLDAHPPVPSFRNDWRDPFVFEGPDGRFKMLLGGADARGAIVLLYETDDPEAAGGWRFVDVLFREPSRRNCPAECPCMVRLDGMEGLWVLIFGLLGSRDEATRRRNLTRTHIGRFDGRAFASLHEHELDFGTDCYAMQVWRGADGPRGIAWAANWTDVHADRDFESAMTLPRRLLWQDGHLLTPPIDSVETLRIGRSVALEPGGRVPLAGGLAEIALRIEPGTPFLLTLDHPTHELALSYDGRALEFHYEPPGNRSVPRYRADIPVLAGVRVFVDVGLIEVYADGGRTCCTKRIESSSPVEAISLARGCMTQAAQVWTLRSPETADPLF